MVSDGRVSGGEVYVKIGKLIEEGPYWDVYSVDCHKCGAKPKFLWKHISPESNPPLKTFDVHCMCGEVISTLLPDTEMYAHFLTRKISDYLVQQKCC